MTLWLITSARHWLEQRPLSVYRPAELEEQDHVRCSTLADIEACLGRRDELRVLLEIDTTRLTAPVQRRPEGTFILGAIEREAIVKVEPLRARTPDEHTLHGVLTRLQLGERDTDPDLQRQLDGAFSRHVAWLKRQVSQHELRGFAEAQVEEVVQETLLIGWRELPRYRPEREFRIFLRSIAVRLCSNLRRRRRDALTADGIVEVTSPERSLLDQLDDRQRNEVVWRAARTVLTPSDQQIAYLRYVLDYSNADIASKLGVTDVDQIRVALQRLHRQLRTEVHKRLREAPPP
jgi:RNA polymerase sigma factor (sigma-70 family)